MADFSALKTSIQNYIKQNGNEEITGNLLQQILLSMVTTLGDSAINDLVTALNNEVSARQNADGTLQTNINNEATARGNADTALSERITTLQGVVDSIVDNIENGYVYAGIATPLSTPATGKVFYLALTAGTYTNFGATVVPQGINILKYNGSAWSLDSFLGLDDAPTQGSNNLVKSGGVLDSIIKDGSAFDLSAYNNGTTYADLSAALTALNALPAAYKKGGMSIKYVQTSDNKYVQARCTANEFTADITKWQNVDDKISELEAEVGEVLYNGVHTFTTNAENIGLDAKSGDILAVKVESSAFASNVFGLRYFNGSTYPWLVKLTEQKFYKVEIPSDIVGMVLLHKDVTDNGFDANIKALTGLLANAASTNENLNDTDKEVEEVKDALSLNVLKDSTETFVANTPKNAIISNVQKGSRIALTISGGESNIFKVRYYNGETYPTIMSISDDEEHFIDVPMDVADGQLLINCVPITTATVYIYANTVGYYKDLKDIDIAIDNINQHIDILSNREYQKYDTIAYGVNGDLWYGNGYGAQKSYIIPCKDNIPFSITANNMDYAPFKFVKEYPVIGSTLADIMVAYDEWNAGAGTTINGIIPSGTKYMVVTIYQNSNTTPTALLIEGIDALRGIGDKINAKNDLTKVLTDASFYEGMKVVKVKKDGLGDFTDIQTAINSIRDASVYNQYDVQIYDDWDVTNMADLIAVEYTTVHATNNDVSRPSCLFVTKDYVHVRGMNGMRTIYLHSSDTNLTERSFQNIQPIFLKGNCILANFHVKVKGGRYAIHQDMSGSGVASPDYKATTIIKDVVAEHLGNSMYTYGSGWQSTQAQANGISDGQTCVFENVKWISHEGSCAFYYHTNANFTIPTISIFKNCQEILLSSTMLEDRYTRISDIGSGVKHFVYMYGCNMPVFTNFKRDATDKGAWLLGYGNRPMLTNETGSGVSMVLENIEDCEEIGSANTSVSVGNALVHDYSINSSGWRLANAGEKAEGVCGEIDDGYIKVILSNKCLFRLSSLGVSQQSIGTYIKSNGNGSWATTANKSEATFVCITTKVCKFVE